MRQNLSIFLATMFLVALAPGLAAAAETGAPDARGVLLNMAHYLAAQPKFRVDVSCSYDSPQANGKKVEFNETRKVTLDRSGRLRADLEESDGQKSALFIDGKTITAQNLTKNVYAQIPAKVSLDE